MPVLANKRPIHKLWEQTKTVYDFSRAEAVGLVCGAISGNIEAFDMDLKYDLTGELFTKFKKAVHELDKTLLSKLLVQKTMNNGYHLIYRCKHIDGNLKIAQRSTTPEEREEKYKREYEVIKKEIKEDRDGKFKDFTVDEKREYCKKNALLRSNGDKVRVLIETRGEKGYIACAPTIGYEIVNGSFDSINEITQTQRDILFNVGYSFNEVLKENFNHKKLPKKEIKGLSPSEDYNERGDVVGLLEKHGWSIVSTRGSKTLLKRPGDTKAESSGNYDHDKKWFSVFSTSTEFIQQTAYLPYAVYAMLECNGDYSAVTKALADEGYGDKLESMKEVSHEVPSMIDMSDDDMSFLAVPSDYNDYLRRWRNGTFEMGKTTGIPELDKHFLFKEGNLVIINGIDNVGKSTTIWYLAMLSALYHGWNWLIFSSENKVGGVIRKLIEFYLDKPIDALTDYEFNEAKKFVEDHFSIIKCSDKLYNYQDILNMTTKASKNKRYHGLMMDPYNSLKVDIPAKNKQSTYEYHYEAASVIQLYGKNNNISIYLNVHVGTTAARSKNKDGFTNPPQKEDTEMGVMFANKADEFLTIHRVTQHETEFMFTEIHVRKVKETETGGKVTPYMIPVLLKGNVGITGFDSTKSKNLHEMGINPVRQFRHNKLKEAQKDLFSADSISYYNEHANSDEEEVPF